MGGRQTRPVRLPAPGSGGRAAEGGTYWAAAGPGGAGQSAAPGAAGGAANSAVRLGPPRAAAPLRAPPRAAPHLPAPAPRPGHAALHLPGPGPRRSLRSAPAASPALPRAPLAPRALLPSFSFPRPLSPAAPPPGWPVPAAVARPGSRPSPCRPWTRKAVVWSSGGERCRAEISPLKINCFTSGARRTFPVPARSRCSFTAPRNARRASAASCRVQRAAAGGGRRGSRPGGSERTCERPGLIDCRAGLNTFRFFVLFSLLLVFVHRCNDDSSERSSSHSASEAVGFQFESWNKKCKLPFCSLLYFYCFDISAVLYLVVFRRLKRNVRSESLFLFHWKSKQDSN